MTSAQITDFLAKIVRAKGFTSVNKTAYEEAINGQSLQTYVENVWLESDDIPGTPPVGDTSIVDVRTNLQLTPDPSIANNRVWIACSTPGDFGTRLTKWIPPHFGRLYSVRLYDNNGTNIRTGNALDWTFFYEQGILVCNTNPDTNFELPLHISGYRYVGLTGVPTVEIDANFEFTVAEIDATNVWTIEHNKGKLMSVTVIDADGNEMHPLSKDYSDPDKNTIVLTFATSRFGTAFCN